MSKPNNSGTPLWRVEENRKLHNNLEVVLDHEINGEELGKAVLRAIEVFPILKDSVVLRDGLCYYEENANEIRVLPRERSIIPGSDALGGHFFCVTYSGRTIRSVISHTMTDGGGMIRFVRTLLYFYMSMHYGREFDHGYIEVEPVPKDELYKDFWEMDHSGAEEVEEEKFIKVGYILPETVKGKQDNTYTKRCEMTIPGEDLIVFSRRHNTSPSVMMFLLFAKAVYRECEDARDAAIAGRITADARKALGIPGTFMNCSLGGQLSVTAEDLNSVSLSELGSSLRTSLKRQISPEYLRYTARKVATERSFPRDLKPTISISYMGTVDFGSMNDHVEKIVMYEGELHKLNAYAFKDVFHLIFHIGDGSERYAKAMSEILKEEGILSSVGPLETMPEETDS